MTIAIYAGSFDPITKGHMSIILQAARMFAHVRVLMAVNPDKKYVLPFLERMQLIQHCVGRIPNVSVDHTQGYVVEYAREIGANFLVRGVRGASDVTYELELATENKNLAPEIQTVLLPADPKLAEVSSSKLKEMIKAGKDVSQWCDLDVAQAVRRQLL